MPLSMQMIQQSFPATTFADTPAHRAQPQGKLWQVWAPPMGYPCLVAPLVRALHCRTVVSAGRNHGSCWGILDPLHPFRLSCVGLQLLRLGHHFPLRLASIPSAHLLRQVVRRPKQDLPVPRPLWLGLLLLWLLVRVVQLHGILVLCTWLCRERHKVITELHWTYISISHALC